MLSAVFLLLILIESPFLFFEVFVSCLDSRSFHRDPIFFKVSDWFSCCAITVSDQSPCAHSSAGFRLVVGPIRSIITELRHANGVGGGIGSREVVLRDESHNLLESRITSLAQSTMRLVIVNDT